jgi:hypothetical protein
MVQPPASSAGNPMDDFREEWQTRILSVATPLTTVTPSMGATAGGIDFVEGSGDASLNDGTGRLFIHAVVLRIDDQRQSVLCLTGTRNMLNAFQRELQLFFSGMTSVQDLTSHEKKDAPVYHADIPDVPSNRGTLYHGYQTSMVGVATGHSPIYLYLFPDNTFQWGYFQRGYYNYNGELEKKMFPDYCGTYTKSGQSIRLHFYKSDFQPEFADDGKGNLRNVSDKYTLFKLPPSDQVTLEGTYTVEAWSGPKPTAKFYRNGRFEDHGLLCSGERIDHTIAPETAQRRMEENKIPGGGTYRIIDNSLILRYDDGRMRQLLFYVVDRTSNPERINVAGSTYTLVKR